MSGRRRGAWFGANLGLLKFCLLLSPSMHLFQGAQLSNKTASNSAGPQQVSTGTRPAGPNRLARSTLEPLGHSAGSSPSEYACARHCSCSLVSSLDENGIPANQTLVRCESLLFNDLLTIDRRTQIMHISLPREEVAQRQLARGQEETSRQERSVFRMPRMVQFSQLNEIVIVNLKFEVCDTEVFKRGQKLKKLKLNHNQLGRLSKACFKHLDKLTELNLNYNKLEELESALFGSLLSLKSLSLAHNLLTELTAHQFANLSQLVSLNLMGNAFTTINLHLLEPMQNSLRLLMLANNQIKAFVYSTLVQPPSLSSGSSAHQPTYQQPSRAALFSGALFKNLIKLNVDNNRLERIKALQLHRFFNVKFLSVRYNLIGSIRDKAFNGLKLIELNLSNNQLQSISMCAFCNSTIKRLVLASNNISLSVSRRSSELGSSSQSPLASALVASDNESEPLIAPSGAPPQNMLILSRSILSPLFAQMNYLDLSNNPQLGDQLDTLLEPLLNLEYLQLANVGTGSYLISPTLFKNIQRLRYLNLSHNQLDQFQAETLEPLQQLEVLDLSHNKFDEIDEAVLVLADEISTLKVINLAHNPWYCSQCKITPLYDWALRSPIYNATCMTPMIEETNEQQLSPVMVSDGSSITDRAPYGLAHGPQLVGDEFEFELMPSGEESLHVQYMFNSQTRGILAQEEDDPSIRQTMKMLALLARQEDMRFVPKDYCLKCEEPTELQTFNIHELAVGDFKFCPGAAPRLISSEPKLGLTLAIIIIGALFCLIIIVIIIYRRKSNTYYPNAEDTDQLEEKSRKKNSDGDHRYGDMTDYSSPPISQSYESYSQEELEPEDEEGSDATEEEEADVDEDEEFDEDGDEQADEEYSEELAEVAGRDKKEPKPESKQTYAPHAREADGTTNGDRVSSAATIDEEIPEIMSASSNGPATKPAAKTRSIAATERSSSGPTPGNSHIHRTKRQSSAHANQVAAFVASQVAWRNSAQSSVSTGASTPNQQVPATVARKQNDTPSTADTPVSTLVGGGGSVRHLSRQHYTQTKELNPVPQIEPPSDEGQSSGREEWQGPMEGVASVATSANSLEFDALDSLELAPTPENMEDAISGGALVPDPHSSLEISGQHKRREPRTSRGLCPSASSHPALTEGDRSEEE